MELVRGMPHEIEDIYGDAIIRYYAKGAHVHHSFSCYLPAIFCLVGISIGDNYGRAWNTESDSSVDNYGSDSLDEFYPDPGTA